MKSKIAVKMRLMIVTVFFLTAIFPGSGKAELRSSLDISPVRIAFDGNGDLLVSDYTYDRILTVASDTLDIIGEFNVKGKPLGVAWANDLVYVGNSTTDRVEVYNAVGEEQFILGRVGMPLDIAVGNGNIYVVDGRDRVVKVFTSDGTFVGTVPKNGYAPDILTHPTAVATDDLNQQIYVSDYGGSDTAGNRIKPRVQVFNYDGSLSYTINAGTINKYRFTMPQGLTVNGNDQLFVIDSFTGKIYIYDAKTGLMLRKMKRTGLNGGSRMKLPLDLVIDPLTHDVFVTNNLMASIKVFTGAGVIR